MTDVDSARHAVLATMVQASRKWRKLAQLALAAHGISQARASALVWVYRLGGGTRQVALASYIGIEGTSLVRLLDELSTAGLLVRKDDPSDRRAKTIWLTAKGEHLAAQIEVVLGTLQDRVLEAIDPADVDATLRIFQAIDRSADLMCSAGQTAAAGRLLVADVPIDRVGLALED